MVRSGTLKCAPILNKFLTFFKTVYTVHMYLRMYIVAAVYRSQCLKDVNDISYTAKFVKKWGIPEVPFLGGYFLQKRGFDIVKNPYL